MTIWNRYQKIYDKLYVQRVSLKPTRDAVLHCTDTLPHPPQSILDIGCATGQLLAQLSGKYPDACCAGIEPSTMCFEASKRGLNVLNLPFEAFQTEKKYDLIVCTHAFPYIENQPLALEKINHLLSDCGVLIIAHAESNTLYDRLALSVVKLTTSKAHYPSAKQMKQWLDTYFNAPLRIRVNAKYIPSIALYKASKRPI